MSSHLYIEKTTTVTTKLRRVRIIEVRECNLRFGKPARSSLETCTKCAGVSILMTPASAAGISAIEIEAICRLVEAGEIHFTLGDAGPLVCLTSLMERDEASRHRSCINYGLRGLVKTLRRAVDSRVVAKRRPR